MVDKLLRLKEVRERLNISTGHLYRLRVGGRLKVLNIGLCGRKGNSVRIRESELNRFIDSLEKAAQN